MLQPFGTPLDPSVAPIAHPSANPFASFWMGGYEGADHVNGEGCALDMAEASDHLAQLDADHARAAALGIGTVRESIGWRLAEPLPGRHDLSRAMRIALSARRHGLQVIWSLMHYGTPPDVSLLDDSLCERFAAFAASVAAVLGPLSPRPPVYNLVNEISFLAWAVSQSNLIHPYRGEQGGQTHGHAVGYAVKCRLVRATLAGIAAIRCVDPRARFLHVEPLIHVAAPRGRPEFDDHAAEVSGHQWQTWDLLAGRDEPQLGGHAAALDLIGVNHYHNSQWEVPGDDRLWWDLRDERRRPFAALLRAAWRRYRRPLMVAETSHVGDGRAAWLDDVAAGVAQARAGGVPVLGLCLYPLIDRPDWGNSAHWHRSGLWDVDEPRGADEPAPPASPASAPAVPHRRVLCAPYAAALARWQQVLPEVASNGVAKPWLVVLSHLRWNSVWHRPQQLMTRLAADWRIVYVEEPRAAGRGSAPRFDRVSQGPDLTVLVPEHAGDAGFHAAGSALLVDALRELLDDLGVADPLLWLCTPLAFAWAARIPHRALVYDCSDDLGGFRDAPAGIALAEDALLGRADLVFTSGPSLQAVKRARRPDAHLVPNAVDAAAFDRERLDPASHDGREADLLQGAIPWPRLGFAGAIDERLDLALIAAIADRHPAWQLVFVGPVRKVDPASLPRRPNLHWLPLQPATRLPHLFAGWDMALLPFVRDASTRFANPTKLLEYTAAGLAVVASDLPDVRGLHARRVWIAADVEAFIAACETVLARPEAERRRAAHALRAAAALHPWDGVAARVSALLTTTLGSSARAA